MMHRWVRDLSCEPNICVSTSELRVWLVPLNMFKSSSNFLMTVPRWCFFCGSFLLFMFYVSLCYATLSVPCSLIITYWEKFDLLALLCVTFSCVFVTFSYGVLGQVWYLIILIPDICLHLYFESFVRTKLSQVTFVYNN